jgi:hypothetical protein
MPEHDRPVDGAGGRRGPASGNPGIEHLVGGRSVIPHGDRVHAAKSCRIEHEKTVGLVDDHVVRELVLDHDVDHVAAVSAAPSQHILERLQTIEAPAHTY